MDQLIRVALLTCILGMAACGGSTENEGGQPTPEDTAGASDAAGPGSDDGTDRSPESSAPAVANVYFSIGENGDLQPAIDLMEDNSVNLASYADTLVNIQATTTDSATTGSVEFMLEGPSAKHRISNTSPYTVAKATEGLNPAAGDLALGHYTLTVTPWSDRDSAGAMGEPVTLTFSVVNEGMEVELQAVDDSYSLVGESVLDVSANQGLLSNDEFEEASALTVSVSEAPSNGQVTLRQDGSFSYTPEAGTAGVDTFTYIVSDGQSSATGRVSVTVEAASTGGFTPIIPSDDSKLIYVSASTGSDENDCLTPQTPCHTITAGREKMREGYPDHLYLKRGDVWRDQGLSNFPSGRSVEEPAMVAFYGDSGPRPKLEVASASNIGKGGINYIHIIGLEFANYSLDINHSEYTGSGSANIVMVGDHQNILFEDNVFRHIEVVSHSHDGSTPRDITFRRNIWTGYYWNKTSYTQSKRPSNIYASIDGLRLIENTFDHGGWHPEVPGAGANMYSHNVYTQAGQDGDTILLKGNILTRGASHGAQLRSGGLAEDNFFARNAIGLLLGYSEPKMVPGARAHAINNVISEGHSMVKGIDACSFNNSCTRAVWGLDVDLRGALVEQDADWQVHGNIVSRLAEEDTEWLRLYDDNTGLVVEAIKKAEDPRVTASNNIAWRWNDDEGEAPDSHTYPDPDRTLADYNASLGGVRNFDAFMQVVLTRPLQTWDERYTAYSINDYIRAGFGR
ncbi:Ig-like domain-containing protein [Marinimicrobium locisalis]|uniref:Ig-like domain-containing protein n=1 Tax=Marinimicrobium locisalis TaxID=546022 RepID=UPI003221DCD6